MSNDDDLFNSSKNQLNTCSSVVFMGTGTSSANPHLNCLLGLGNELFQKPGGCDVCQKASHGNPLLNKNNRLNPSLLVMFNGHDDGETRVIQVDAGKTWLEGARRWFLKLGVPRLHAVLLTHDHADAMFGLDDLRLAQPKGKPLDVYLSADTFMSVRQTFSYLVKSNPIPRLVGAGLLLPTNIKNELYALHKNNENGKEEYGNNTSIKNCHCKESTNPQQNLFVANLRWNIMCKPSIGEALVPFTVEGMTVIPFRVWHGQNYLSLGFAFGRSNRKFVYISDVSEIPGNIMTQLQTWDVQYLVIDTLHPSKRYPTHMSLEQSLLAIEAIKPHECFLVGVSHMFDHDSANLELAKLRETKGLNVQIAYDGLKLDLLDIDL